MIETFAPTGATARVHALALDDPEAPEVALDADAPVVLVSVFKVLLVLEYARQVAAGQVDPAERLRIRAEDRQGGVGTSACLDDVDMSVRDLAMFAMSLSDNTAADVLLRRVGLDTVQSLTKELGLAATRVLGGPGRLIEMLLADAGAADAAEFARVFPALGPARLRTMRVRDPARTSASTARDMTRLLALIWRDEAGPPEACAYVRALMTRQVNWHRFGAAFGDEVLVAAKSGTLLDVRNEIGVIEYPDGHRYAVAVFTQGAWGLRRPDVDAAIGRAARLAVERLRGR